MNNYRRIVTILIALALTSGSMVVALARSGWCAETVICNEARPPSPAAAVKALEDGNARWSAGTPRHPGRDYARRECVAEKGQTPFAAILSCADSRVPPELLFDEGVGDLFVVRVAGNSVDKLGEQSLDYAASHLGVETILVLGHQKCGAVKAAVDSYPGAAPEFLKLIYAGIAKAKEVIQGRGGSPDDKAALGAEAIDQHVIGVVHQLSAEHPFAEMIGAGKLKIVGGRYDLDTGHVTMLTE
jgi:carbonic anhydrase